MREGWEQTTLGDLLRLEYGKALPAKNRIPGDVVVFGSNGAVGTHNKSLVEGPGIVVGRKGTAGSVTWSDSDFFPIDTTYWARVDRSRLSIKFAFHVLCNSDLPRLNTQTGVPGLNRDNVYREPVSLPPLREQRRIVDLMDSVDAAISAAQKEVDSARALEARINLEVFRPLLAGATVEVSARTDMKLGRQKGGAATADAPKYATVKSGSITSAHMVNSESFDEMPIPESWIKDHGLRPGDVVLAEGGTVGESAVWPPHLDGDYGYDKHVIRLRPVIGKSTTEFIAHWCRFMKASGTFDATATGMTIRALGFGRAAKLPFPDLDVGRQRNEVGPLVAAESAASTAQAALDSLRELRSSMLTVLLSGEHEIPETYDQFLTEAGEA